MTEVKVVPVKLDSLPSAKKTMDLFSKAREALNNPSTVEYSNEILSLDHKEHQKVREVEPMKNIRNALWKKAEDKTDEKTIKSPKNKVEIPFSKNRYEEEDKKIELVQVNKKKAIEFLKKQKEDKAKKQQEMKSLLEKKKQYTEQVRRKHKDKLKKHRKRDHSAEKMNSDIKVIPPTTSIRAKSEEIKGKSHRLSKRYNRNRNRTGNHSEAKRHRLSKRENINIKTLSMEDEGHKKTIDQQLSRIEETEKENRRPPPPKIINRVSISVNLAQNTQNIHLEPLPISNMENSEQKTSIEEENAKYIKTPELNMGEKYSHKYSDNKLSAHSVEKEAKKTTRCLSSHKKKSLKVAQEIQECKRDLIKMQKLNNIRKRKIVEESEHDKDIERRKQNLETLNYMLKKRNKHFKKKKRNEEKLLKKDLDHFDRSIGTSFNKKTKKRKFNMKNIKRNQTFSCLSSKGPCDTMNTSKNEICTEKKQNNQHLEFKISIKKDNGLNQESSNSVVYSPNSKPVMSSHKKRSSGTRTSKKYSAKKNTESIKTNSSSKLKSGTKLPTRSSTATQFVNQKKSNVIPNKKKKVVQSEQKKSSTVGINQFNDISEIQEFNMTDEESLINSSILKNIEDHGSINQDAIYRDSTQKMKFTTDKKNMQSTTKKPKKTNKKVKKMKFISSAKKNIKKRKKSQPDNQKETERKSLKKRKVVFHLSKKAKAQAPEQADYVENSRDGQIKKVDISYDLPHRQPDELDSENIVMQEESSPQNKNIDKKYEKLEMIDSAKLSELLSSKKKHRYNEVKDSMDDVIDQNVEQHINFTNEEANLQINEYQSPDSSIESRSLEGVEHDIDTIEEDRQS